jgi:S-DNA-T family DNA segregation ATPase FtsK/SpoIIIE
MAKASAPPPVERRPAIREACGLTLALLATFGFLALASYHPADSADIVYPANDQPANAGGRVGATLAYGLFFSLGGVASIALVGLLAAWGVAVAVVKEARTPLALRVAGVALLLATLSAADAMLDLAPLAGLPGGGALGAVLGPWFLGQNFGTTGTYLILIYAALCSLLLATDFLFYRTGIEMWGRSRAWAQAVRAAVLAKDAAARAAVATGAVARQAASAAATRIAAAVNDLDADAQIDAEVAAAAAEQGLPSADGRTDAGPPDPPEARPPRHRPSRRARRPVSSRALPAPRPTAVTTHGPFVLPDVRKLAKPEPADPKRNESVVKEKGRAIERSLRSFKVDARVVDVQVGPTITQYELELAQGVRVQAVRGLANDLAVALKSAKVRVVAPIPGRDTVGVEVGNPFPAVVRLSELLADGTARTEHALPLFLGKGAAGRPLVADLAEMPHLLVAGASGSGKSTCLYSILASLCYTRSPEEVRFLLIDPKVIELAAFNGIPHLLAPPVTDAQKAVDALRWLVDEMNRRYERFAQAGVRGLRHYNDLSREELAERLGPESAPEDLEPMPRIVLVMDEVGDLMATASRKEVEQQVARLAQKARAAGVHVVLATQRPSADVLTGLIKANLPCRIAFQVTSKVNSMVILDQPGAEDLMGQGDMLYQPPGAAGPIRAQGTFVADDEVRAMVEHLRTQGTPRFVPALTGTAAEPELPFADGDSDPLFAEAAEAVLELRRASATLLQRRLSVGYSRAARLLDQLEAAGVVGPHQDGRARKVLVTAAQWAARDGAAAPAA